MTRTEPRPGERLAPGPAWAVDGVGLVCASLALSFVAALLLRATVAPLMAVLLHSSGPAAWPAPALDALEATAARMRALAWLPQVAGALGAAAALVPRRRRWPAWLALAAAGGVTALRSLLPAA